MASTAYQATKDNALRRGRERKAHTVIAAGAQRAVIFVSKANMH
jgi:hypothetical protein